MEQARYCLAPPQAKAPRRAGPCCREEPNAQPCFPYTFFRPSASQSESSAITMPRTTYHTILPPEYASTTTSNPRTKFTHCFHIIVKCNVYVLPGLYSSIAERECRSYAPKPIGRERKRLVSAKPASLGGPYGRVGSFASNCSTNRLRNREGNRW